MFNKILIKKGPENFRSANLPKFKLKRKDKKRTLPEIKMRESFHFGSYCLKCTLSTASKDQIQLSLATSFRNIYDQGKVYINTKKSQQKIKNTGPFAHLAIAQPVKLKEVSKSRAIKKRLPI